MHAQNASSGPVLDPQYTGRVMARNGRLDIDYRKKNKYAPVFLQASEGTPNLMRVEDAYRRVEKLMGPIWMSEPTIPCMDGTRVVTVPLQLRNFRHLLLKPTVEEAFTSKPEISKAKVVVFPVFDVLYEGEQKQCVLTLDFDESNTTRAEAPYMFQAIFELSRLPASRLAELADNSLETLAETTSDDTGENDFLMLARDYQEGRELGVELLESWKSAIAPDQLGMAVAAPVERDRMVWKAQMEMVQGGKPTMSKTSTVTLERELAGTFMRTSEDMTTMKNLPTPPSSGTVLYRTPDYVNGHTMQVMLGSGAKAPAKKIGTVNVPATDVWNDTPPGRLRTDIRPYMPAAIGEVIEDEGEFSDERPNYSSRGKQYSACLPVGMDQTSVGGQTLDVVVYRCLMVFESQTQAAGTNIDSMKTYAYVRHFDAETGLQVYSASRSFDPDKTEFTEIIDKVTEILEL